MRLALGHVDLPSQDVSPTRPAANSVGVQGDRHQISALDPRFPSALAGCVPELFGCGDCAAWDALLTPPEAATRRAPRVTLVGSRAASDVGLNRAHDLAFALAQRGAVVVSGGALGIDGAAHQGALAAHGISWAVLGSGLDQLYPRRHLSLFAQLAQHGLLLSPFASQAPPRPQHFPKRNQVMAALSDVVVVIEAGLSSGTRYTADAAARLGRPVICFPSSPGTLALLQAGAHSVQTIAEAVEQTEQLSQTVASGDAPVRAPMSRSVSVAAQRQAAAPTLPKADVSSLSADSARVLQLLCAPDAVAQGRDISDLSALSGLPVSVCAAAVIELELYGWCSRLPGGRYMGRASL